MSISTKLWHILSSEKLDTWPTKLIRWSIASLIALNALAIVLESYDDLESRYATHFRCFEILSVAVFSLEYLLRLGLCVNDERYQGAIVGRIKWMASPMAVIDMLAIAPFFLPFLALDLRFLRTLRVLRVLRVAKFGRFSRALQLTIMVFKAKKEQLIASLVLMLFCIFMASCIMYHFECKAQPDAFPSIPATMWWAVVTLTTIGYGDVYPITVGGKIVSCVFALLAIGVVALPTGILSSGFVEVFELRHEKRKEKKFCPNCGEDLS